ncbi:putative glucan endo-1,3-beta-glucosidase btgC [Golovinomyces cichoracearum]|uniref:glucan endo-1,3-beta-D-glucosidase n=1 Tax=Golovinomyces cichoracearum TaxID=62708 RepID=A0A420HAN7_9PEZI|nr:putative glucan endo-1,3-beta-glucosidase btgC [Golovinomyces cichoracearum]
MFNRHSLQHLQPKYQGTCSIDPFVTVDFLQNLQCHEADTSYNTPDYSSQHLSEPSPMLLSSASPENAHFETDSQPPLIHSSKVQEAVLYHDLNREPHSVAPLNHNAPDRSWDHNVRKKEKKNFSACTFSKKSSAQDLREKIFSQEASHLHGTTNENSNHCEREVLREIQGHTTKMDHPSDDQFNYSPYRRSEIYSEPSHSSQAFFSNSASALGHLTPPSWSTVSSTLHSQNREQYSEVPYRYSRNVDSDFCDFDPRSIEDDGDDGLEYKQRQRLPVMNFCHSERNSLHASTAISTYKGGMLGSTEGATGKKSNNSPTDSLKINSMSAKNGRYGVDDFPKAEGPTEPVKSEWLSKQSSARSKLRLLVLLIVTLVIVGGITGGVVRGILQKKSSSSPSDSSAADLKSNGDLSKDSAEIKKLLNNPKLHKVFPTIDYTPARSQYPDCLNEPPSQNDITRDLAVLSQLSNTIRLYGTDCNQTEMLIHSINQLDLKENINIWMGVWLNKNETTNKRQISQMYQILDEYGTDPFVGVIVGNEVLFREDMTVTELGNMLTGIKSNLTSKGISLPIASSDLGDDWTSQLASKTDILMANIHPFFAGVAADVAASWTWNFWQQHNVILQPDVSKNIISETGWPSSGGTSCGGAATCTAGSVASVESLNTFMNDWVCQALANGTKYFWFEAFDEPWKVGLNEPGKEWEDKWGLLDAERRLKPGVIIPSCGGKTVD